MSGIVEYLCTSEEHQVVTEAADPLIAVDGMLCYCPAGAVEGHDWRATGGRTLATVREWMRRPAIPEPLVAVEAARAADRR